MVPRSVSAKVCIDRMPSTRDEKVRGTSGGVGIKDRLNGSRLIAAIGAAENEVILSEHNIDRASEARRRSHNRAECENLADCSRLPIMNRNMKD